MDKKKINTIIWTFITILSSVISRIGVSFATVPFVASWLPSARAKAMGAPIDIDVSLIDEGQKVT